MDPPATICMVFLLPLKISDIESRIAALSAAGLTVKSVEKTRKKSSRQVDMEVGVRGPSPEMSVLPRVAAAGPGCCEGLPGLLSCFQLPPCCPLLCPKAPRVDVSLRRGATLILCMYQGRILTGECCCSQGFSEGTQGCCAHRSLDSTPVFPY